MTRARNLTDERGRPQKQCARCRAILPLTAFSRDRTSRDGHRFHCRPCVKAYDTARYDPVRRRQHNKTDRRRLPKGRGKRTRAFLPLQPPTGRVRKLSLPHIRGQGGETRLGCLPDKSDFNPAFCLARRQYYRDQCAMRPRRGFTVCERHGIGLLRREQEGLKMAPKTRNVLSGVSKRLKQLKREQKPIDLGEFVAHLPEFGVEVAALRDQPELLDLSEQTVALTAMINIVLSGKVPALTVPEVARMLMSLSESKANVLRTKEAIERKGYVPAERVQSLLVQVIGILQRYCPAEAMPSIARELRLIGATEGIGDGPQP